ncbi:hypothetical protein SBRCBS47491_005099 [Sporothrix bragantina]|uniref:Autophagy-related protein 29 n=1 Tax=Sporothrix bragantina TaxID=671064 RepID=A0ABP0BTR8_9PEZI
MDFDPKHDQALDLPLRFPDDPVEEPPSSASMRRQKSQEPQHKSSQKQASSPTAPPPAPPPNYTIYIRVPAPRNGFVDPPDVDWNKEKDEALWQILSRASKNDIDWEELAENFSATVDFLLIQATILTERHVSQVRAQTRKVATLGGAAGGRDSPMQSPALAGTGGGVGASRLTATPTSEAMGRTLSGGGRALPTSEAMRRMGSTDSRTGQRTQGSGGGGSSGSRRPSIEEASQARPARPSRPSLETISSYSRGVQSPVGRGHPTYSPATAQHHQTRREPPLPIRPARPTDTGGGGSSRRGAYETEGDDEGEDDDGGVEPESPAALSESSSSSSSSTPSEPVMSRIFKRPPGHPLHTQQRKQRGGEAGYGVVGLGISSGGSEDDDDESETQAAFLRFQSPAQVAHTAAPTASGGGSGSGTRNRPHQHPTRLQHRRSNTGDSSSASSSTSASPTTKVFKAQTIAAAAAAAASGGNPGNATSASAMAAARLQSSRVPGIRSPPRLQKTMSGRSPAVLAAKAAGISREGSETGTTPSIGSSFSDLDDVSFTQSILDEALGSKVEDTVVTPNPNNIDPMSSSATRRQR